MGLELPKEGSQGKEFSRSTRLALSAMPYMYRMVGGVGMGATLVLSTKGRTSGLRRDVHLAYFEQGVSWLVVASHEGDKRHPAWVKNLAAHPGEVFAQVGWERMKVKVEILKGRERSAAWAQVVEKEPMYEVYASRTDRQIPVVRLTAVEVVKQKVVVTGMAGAALAGG